VQGQEGLSVMMALIVKKRKQQEEGGIVDELEKSIEV